MPASRIMYNTTLDHEALTKSRRLEAFVLMNEALGVLDSSAIDPLVGAKLQAALDALENIDCRESIGGKSVPPAIANHFVQDLAAADGSTLREAIDALSVPAYATDASGQVNYWNQHCVTFAGREPELGSDKWCVTWKLYTMLGDQLPHDQCAMAVAINERREVRGEVAIAERPDGRRVAVTPYPTPIFDKNGQLTGAVNILIDVSRSQRNELRFQSGYCRRLAQTASDSNTKAVLNTMAESFEASADSLAGN